MVERSTQNESVEINAYRRHVPIPHAASATSRTWPFCSGAGILQAAQWQSPVALLHPRTDAAQFSRDGVHNRHNSHVWSDENLHATVESNFQIRFIVSVWCAVLDDQVIGPFIFEGRLAGEMYLRRRNCSSVCRMWGARGGVVGSGTALQAGTSRVRFPMVSLEFFIDIIVSVALWPWGRLSL
jgi:hypothetical protein